MREISVLEVEITFTDGRKQALTIDAESALVGSGAHCEVRLPPEDAAIEQLEIRVSAAGCSARVRNFEPRVLLDGVPFQEGPLSPEAVLAVGSAELRLRRSSPSRAEARGKTRSTSGNRAIHLLAVIGFPIGFSLLLGARSREGKLPEPIAPPVLFSRRAEPCKVSEPGAARALGERLFGQALALRERAPFDGESGVRAVHSFERAAACLRLDTQSSRAEEANRIAAELRRDVERAFHVHHVRLERALLTQRYDVARREIALLLAFLGKSQSDYREWLFSLDRNLELKFSGRKRQ